MARFPIKIKAIDYLIFFFALSVIALISAQVYSGTSSSSQITISGVEGRWVYPLDQEQTVSIAGPLGETVVRIEEGTVRVLSSPCPEKLCIKTGRIEKPGQWIACLPNRVLITIRGRGTNQPDAISR